MVEPVYELAPLNVKVPEPALVKVLAPEIAPVIDAAAEFVTLKLVVVAMLLALKVALSTTKEAIGLLDPTAPEIVTAPPAEVNRTTDGLRFFSST